jgi:hypothetical protein
MEKEIQLDVFDNQEDIYKEGDVLMIKAEHREILEATKLIPLDIVVTSSYMESVSYGSTEYPILWVEGYGKRPGADSPEIVKVPAQLFVRAGTVVDEMT